MFFFESFILYMNDLARKPSPVCGRYESGDKLSPTDAPSAVRVFGRVWGRDEAKDRGGMDTLDCSLSMTPIICISYILTFGTKGCACFAIVPSAGEFAEALFAAARLARSS